MFFKFHEIKSYFYILKQKNTHAEEKTVHENLIIKMLPT